MTLNTRIKAIEALNRLYEDNGINGKEYYAMSYILLSRSVFEETKPCFEVNEGFYEKYKDHIDSLIEIGFIDCIKTENNKTNMCINEHEIKRLIKMYDLNDGFMKRFIDFFKDKETDVALFIMKIGINANTAPKTVFWVNKIMYKIWENDMNNEIYFKNKDALKYHYKNVKSLTDNARIGFYKISHRIPIKVKVRFESEGAFFIVEGLDAVKKIIRS